MPNDVSSRNQNTLLPQSDYSDAHTKAHTAHSLHPVQTVHVKFVHILNRRLGAGGIVKRYFVRIRFTQITDFKRQPAIYDGQFSIQW